MVIPKESYQHSYQMSGGRGDGVLAFFLDIENLIAGAATLGIPLDLKPVIRRLSRQGRIATRRCFGDINAACRGIDNPEAVEDIRRNLQRNLFIIEDIPHTTQNKNSADMRLIIEALSLAFTNESIDQFVILSSDRDYVPLVLKLRELGRYVTTVAVSRENVNQMVLEASDQVLYYHEIVAPSHQRAREGSVGVGYDARKREALLEQTLEQLGEAVSTIEQSGKEPVSNEIMAMMKRLVPDFAVESLGLLSFRALLNLGVERGILVATTGATPEDTRFSIPDHPPTLPTNPSEKVPALAKFPEKAVHYLSNLVLAIATTEREGKATSGARIAGVLPQLIPNYDLRTAGFDSFKKLVQAAQETGLLITTNTTGDFPLNLTDEGKLLVGIRPGAGAAPGDTSTFTADESEEPGAHVMDMLETKEEEHFGQQGPEHPTVAPPAPPSQAPGVTDPSSAAPGTPAAIDNTPYSGPVINQVPASWSRPTRPVWSPRYGTLPYRNDDSSEFPQGGESGSSPEEFQIPHSLPPQPSRPPRISRDLVPQEAENYRLFIKFQLKLPDYLPPVAVWERLLQLAYEIFQRHAGNEGLYLNEWKDYTLPASREAGIDLDEAIVYKLLLSLRYAQCLNLRNSTQNNPVVVGFAKAPSDWSDAILRNLANQLMRIGRFKTIYPSEFAKAFIGRSEEDQSRAERILEDL